MRASFCPAVGFAELTELAEDGAFVDEVKASKDRRPNEHGGLRQNCRLQRQSPSILHDMEVS